MFNVTNVSDLKIEIIAAVSQPMDTSFLKDLRDRIAENAAQTDEAASSPWKGADVEIYSGVSFADLMKEQNYPTITFEEFTAPLTSEDWEVSLDTLLKIY